MCKEQLLGKVLVWVIRFGWSLILMTMIGWLTSEALCRWNEALGLFPK